MYQQRLVTGTVVLEAPKLPKDGNANVFKHDAGSIYGDRIERRY